MALNGTLYVQSSDRVELVLRDVKRSMAGQRMKACMAAAGMNAASSCMAKAKILMNSISTTPVSDEQMHDSFLVTRSERFSR